MSRTFAVAGGLLFVASLLFFVASYAWGFVGAGAWSWERARSPVLVDALMFTGFALHHSVFARTGVKKVVERVAGASLERAVYVWIASILFFLVCAKWRPVPGVLWHAPDALGWLLRVLQLGGGVLTVVAARRLDVLSLAGIRQVLDHDAPDDRHATTNDTPPLDDRGPYRLVRHPIYLGWFLLVWSVPMMNGTRLLFAAISCLYLVVAIPLEEREMRRTFGEAYGRYAATVRWRLLPFIY